MKRFLIISLLLILSLTISGCGKKTQPEGTVTPKPMADLSNKKILMIVAKKDFRDEEYQKPREVLEREGAEVKIGSSSLEETEGMFGIKVKPDILLSEAKAEDFDAIIFVGGVGASEYWQDATAHKIALEAMAQNKVLAAICIAPVTLAQAGVLAGKNATVWSSEKTKLEEKGANYLEEDVVQDGKIITASGPKVAQEFGEKIAMVLAE